MSSSIVQHSNNEVYIIKEVKHQQLDDEIEHQQAIQR